MTTDLMNQVFVSSCNSHVKLLIPKIMTLGSGDFMERIEPVGWRALICGISTLMREILESSFSFPSTPSQGTLCQASSFQS